MFATAPPSSAFPCAIRKSIENAKDVPCALHLRRNSSALVMGSAIFKTGLRAFSSAVAAVAKWQSRGLLRKPRARLSFARIRRLVISGSPPAFSNWSPTRPRRRHQVWAAPRLSIRQKPATCRGGQRSLATSRLQVWLCLVAYGAPLRDCAPSSAGLAPRSMPSDVACWRYRPLRKSALARRP